jgi:sugar phosphate isomerase/epimerase
MKLGLFTALFQQLPLEAVLDKAKSFGIEAVEFGTGGYPGKHHCDPDRLLDQPTRISALLKGVQERGMMISALSVHGNPIHPNTSLARESHEAWRSTVKLARQLEVPVINVLSGCPGDPSGSRYPNWVTCSWPPDYPEILDWQWKEKVIPYWSEEARYAADNGVKIAVEMHPGFVVYNPETALRLRDACGEMIGCNFDPSHLFWLGIDATEAIKALGRAGAIFHVHAKDTYVDLANTRRNGVLDTKHYSNVLDRAWTFRSVGYGQGEKVWRDIVSALRAVGYDYVISIEHEDPLASVDEGLSKSATLLRNFLFSEKPVDMFWA